MTRLRRMRLAFFPGADGFTLVEVLVAMTILVISATVILGYVRTLMQRAEREQAHQLAVLRVLNDSLRLVHGGARDAGAPRLEGDKLVIAPLNPARDALPPVEVRNFSALGEVLPAVGLAYTPYQVFGVAREGYSLHLLGPSLPPPAGAAPLAGGAITPDMLQTPRGAPPAAKK